MAISGFRKLADSPFKYRLDGLPSIEDLDGALKWLEVFNANSEIEFKYTINSSSSTGGWFGNTALKNRDVGYETIVANASTVLNHYKQSGEMPRLLTKPILKVKTEIDDFSNRDMSGRLYASTNAVMNIINQMLLNPVIEAAEGFDVNVGYKFEKPLLPRSRNLSKYQLKGSMSQLGDAFVNSKVGESLVLFFSDNLYVA